MRRSFSKKTGFIFGAALLALACLHAPALAAPEDDQQTLDMFYEAKDLVVTASRNPKPLSESAENITVITAADIEMMGAHTLTDVLNNVPGLQAETGSVGFSNFVSIQGADQFHFLVLLDGVTLNFLGDSHADIAAIPVQNIERIEIVKGPGSSSWGSALGGVINIVTKYPREGKKLGGTLSASIGERLTSDLRGEAAGTVGSLGYYLYGGRLASDGFRVQTAVDETNLYAKLRWELPEKGSLLFTAAYNHGGRGDGDTTVFDLLAKNTYNYFFSTVSFNYPLNDRIDLDLSLRAVSRSTHDYEMLLSTGEPLPDIPSKETDFGGSAKLAWREGINSLAVGADFDHIDHTSNVTNELLPLASEIKVTSDKWGIFLDDTLKLGDLAISPGIRFDRMPQTGDFVSPSLGIAWSPTDHVTLRFYGARGYSLPVLLPDQPQEKVFTLQAGVETTLIPYLWLKTTFFRNQLSDVGVFNPDLGIIVPEKQLKQGVEVEGRTVPLFNTSFAAGYTFIEAKKWGSAETLQGIPSQIVKLRLYYDDRRSLKGTLLGRYVWWNAPPDFHAKYSAVIWDLNLAKKVLSINDTSLEIFFAAHNIFNGAQYNDEVIRNPRRWVEGGVRCTF
jgi:vitamin B12 transporter